MATGAVYLCLLMFVMIIAGCNTEPPPDPADPVTANETAKEKLAERGSNFKKLNNWYDSSEDQLRRIELVEPEYKPQRRYNEGDFSALKSFFVYAIWTIIGLALLALAWFLGRGLLGFLRTEDIKADLGVLAEEKRRIEALPLEGRRSDVPFLDMARKLYEQGNYAEAIVYYFSHQLIELDRRKCIRLTRGKTNRQYEFELRHRAELQDIYNKTMIVFEESYFGNQPPDRARFESCWLLQDRFRSLLEGGRS